ncbi:MAG: CvpA family protein [Hyphomicrobium sp.]|nr:CvpA family protein [Hyphomicrobium sp.]
MIGPLTYLDAGLIAVALISGLLAMYRGLTRELLSIVSWAVAAIAVLYFVLNHKKLAEDVAAQMGAQIYVAQIAIGALIFLVTLIIVHLVTSRLSDVVLDSSVGMIDRVLGFVFGLARGFILVVIPYMFYDSFFPDPAQQVQWVREAKSQPYLKSTGDSIRSMLETHMPQNIINPQPAPAGEQQG